MDSSLEGRGPPQLVPCSAGKMRVGHLARMLGGLRKVRAPFKGPFKGVDIRYLDLNLLSWPNLRRSGACIGAIMGTLRLC